MKDVIAWVQRQCGLQSARETVCFLLLSAAGWIFCIYQYLYGMGLSEAVPLYAGY